MKRLVMSGNLGTIVYSTKCSLSLFLQFVKQVIYSKLKLLKGSIFRVLFETMKI